MPQIPSGLLAGASVQGIVDGTTVTGATLVADGSQGQILVYEGTPGTGNLIGSWSGAAGQDPYGNTYPQGLNVTVGAISGTDYLINSAGMFFYSGTPGAGNLVLSIAPSGGTDGFGNTYQAGFQVQNAGGFRVTGTASGNCVIELNGGLPYLGMQTGAAEEAQAGGLESQILSPGASEVMTMYVFGPKGTTHTDQVWIDLNSQAADGSSDALGELLLGNNTGSHVWLTWGSSGIAVYSPYSGDTIAYQTERYTLNMPSNNPVTINTGPYSQSIIGSGSSLGVGTYHVHGQIAVHPGTGGSTTTFAFALGTSGSLALTGMRVFWLETLVQNATGLGNSAWQTALAPSGFTTSNVGSGGTDRSITFDGTVIVSTAGVLNLYAATNNTADTFTVYGFGTYMEICPIGS